jgi:outer membrane lipoprotein-sorting protein
MKNRSRVRAGMIVSLALTLSACAQQGHRGMAESEMMEGQKMKTEAGMMDKIEKDGNVKKEQMKDQNKDAM